MKRKVTDLSLSEINRWKSYALGVTKDLKERRIFFNAGDSSIELSPSECIRAVSEKFKEDPVRNLLLKCLADAESQAAGASFVALSIIAGTPNLPVASGKKFDISKLEKGLRDVTDDFTSRIVVESFRLAGRSGKIIIDKQTSVQSEIIYGSQACKWKPDHSFFSAVGKNVISSQNCKLIFIDGIIESVSECHRIFQSSYEENTPVAIFARGFAEDVVATAAVNFQRGTARIIPIVVHFDEIGVNSLGDLATCFNAEVISSDKGQLISSVDIKDQPTVTNLRTTVEITEIECYENNIEQVVKSLSDRIAKSDVSQSDLLRKRVEALGAGTVTIRVGSEKKSCSGIFRDRVDFGVRFVRDCVSSGMLEFDGQMLPGKSIKVGTKCAASFQNAILNCGSILRVDRCG